ncbi:hypothetical protein Syun_018061 [Stephania yunnanensis]|uniref:Uncharacterized protein n=1 Tax=Stephania yunnanensis TaxID=152371 RepID=A0AAP0NVV3_9MAGN
MRNAVLPLLHLVDIARVRQHRSWMSGAVGDFSLLRRAEHLNLNGTKKNSI